MRAGRRFDVARFIEWLDEQQIRYLVIGGHAVRAYGSPRFTHDVDFWVSSTDRIRVLQHLEDAFDMELSADPADVRRPLVVAASERDKVDCFFTRGMSTPDGVHIDFETVYARSVLMAGPRPPAIRVPAIDDLILLKQLRRQRRAHDIEDIEFLRVCKQLGTGD